MAPIDRPLPRFVAEPPHELEPYGRWAERLTEHFGAACAAIENADAPVPGADAIAWYPERTYCGRTYVPATVDVGPEMELFGYVSFVRPEDGEAHDFRAVADVTDETAALNPEWKIDLSDEVVAGWRGAGQARGEVTLVWGTPTVRTPPRGAVVTAELGGETVDQCDLSQAGRFTLVALDAVTGLGDDLYLEVKLWGPSGLLASESLYEPDVT